MKDLFNLLAKFKESNKDLVTAYDAFLSYNIAKQKSQPIAILNITVRSTNADEHRPTVGTNHSE